MNKTTFLVIALGIYAGMTYATTMSNDTTAIHRAVVLTGNENHSSYETMKAVYEANGLHFQDPRAPRFLLLDKRGRVALGMGGYVKGTLSVDFAGIANNPDFVTATIPVPLHPDMRNQFQMDVSTSRLFLKLVGRNTAIGDFTVYMESDFRGLVDGYFGMRLRQAYVHLWRIKAGLAWSTFTDAEVMPPTIDFAGPSGGVCTHNLMLQYNQPLGEHWNMAVAAEMPVATYTTINNISSSIKQRIPDVPVYLQYTWGKNRSHVRLSGLFRALSYRNIVAAHNSYTVGWAAQLSSVINCGKHVTIYCQGVYGRGYADYLNDLGGNGYDLIPSHRSGMLMAPYAMGIVGGVQYTFNPSWFVSASYSQCRLYDTTSMSSNTYRYGQYVVANVFYNLFNNCQLALEYLYGNRHNIDGLSGNAHRINAMIQYNF